MPPALAPLEPEVLRDVLIKAGWELSATTTRCWELYRNSQEIILPRKGDYVEFGVMMDCLAQAELDYGDLWDILAKIGKSFYVN